MFEVPKKTGLAYANLLRTVIIETSQSVKPIGIAFKDGSNTFIPSDNLAEVIGFCQKLSDLDFVASEALDFPVTIDYTFQGSLKSKDLANSDISVVDGNVELLHAVDKSKQISFSVIYGKGSGKVSAEDNKQIIESFSGYGSFRALASRYSDSNVSFEVKDNLDSDLVVVNVISKSGSEKEKIHDAINSIMSNFNKIQ